MTQLPPSYPPGLGPSPSIALGGERTSKSAVIGFSLAVLSLVLCCLPVVSPAMGLVGSLLCFVGIYRISRGGGLVRGKGLAITGIVVGTLTTLAGVACVGIGISGARMYQRYGDALAAVENLSASEANLVMTPGAMGSLDEARMRSFREWYQSRLGSYAQVKPGAKNMILGYMDLGQAGFDFGSLERDYPGMAPIAMRVQFAQGEGVLLVMMDGQSGSPKYPGGRVENLGVMDKATGEFEWLIPPAGSSHQGAGQGHPGAGDPSDP